VTTPGDRVSARIAVLVSGAGTNLRALHAAGTRGELGGRIELVLADRSCPALDWAAEQGLSTRLVARGGDEDVRAALAEAAIDVVVLAGYLRLVGPGVLEAWAGRILNVHPSLLPAFPGAHAVRDALAAGVAITGVTVHLVDATLDGGPILLQEPVVVQPDDDERSLLARVHAAEHRLLPRAVALVAAGGVRVEPGRRRAVVDVARADASMAVPRRALLSVSDKMGLAVLGTGLVELGFELLSTGGTARALREAGLPVTDISAVTGTPEMLDGRVKTLHPRIHGGILGDRRHPAHRETQLVHGIEPIEIVVVNLYPFREAASRPGIAFDALVEEIDIGGPALVRAAAKNHANVAVVTSPARYEAVLGALRQHGRVPPGMRAGLAVEAYRHTAAYDARIAAELPVRMCEAGVELPPWPGLWGGGGDVYPATLTISLEKVDELRYGENPHQPAARYRRTDREPRPGEGPFSVDRPPLQGKALSYNNVLDAAAAASIARLLRGPAAVVVKHTNPCGAAERTTLLDAWLAARAGDPVSAFGGVVALTGTVDVELARALTDLFLEVVVAPAVDPAALPVLATKPNLRVLLDPDLDAAADRSGLSRRGMPAVDYLGAIRSAGGAVLVSAPDTLPDDPSGWVTTSRRPPTDAEAGDLDLAWRLVRGVTSNAIVIVRNGMQIGLGSGQTSRVDACRQAVAKAVEHHGRSALTGASAASDAFFPFPDGPEVLLEAGVTAIVQPGGSLRDAEVLAAVDGAGATMLVTGTRHFRH